MNKQIPPYPSPKYHLNPPYHYHPGQTHHLFCLAAAAKSLQSCPTLCDPRDGSPPGSPVPGILQAITLEWVAISFSNAWKWKVKVNSLSRVRLLATLYCSPPGSSVHGIFQAPPWTNHHLLCLRHLQKFPTEPLQICSCSIQTPNDLKDKTDPWLLSVAPGISSKVLSLKVSHDPATWSVSSCSFCHSRFPAWGHKSWCSLPLQRGTNLRAFTVLSSCPSPASTLFKPDPAPPSGLTLHPQ